MVYSDRVRCIVSEMELYIRTYVSANRRARIHAC